MLSANYETNIVVQGLGVENRRQWSEGAINTRICFTRNYGNKMRMRACGGPTCWAHVGATWVKSTWAWHTHETPSSNSYRITCISSFTSAMHLSIVGLPPFVGHMYRRVVNKLFFERGKRAVFEKCVEKLIKLVIQFWLINRLKAISILNLFLFKK